MEISEDMVFFSVSRADGTWAFAVVNAENTIAVVNTKSSLKFFNVPPISEVYNILHTK